MISAKFGADLIDTSKVTSRKTKWFHFCATVYTPFSKKDLQFSLNKFNKFKCIITMFGTHIAKTARPLIRADLLKLALSVLCIAFLRFCSAGA